jgi:membrane-bound metal-dependent hydrolase YbcI (DUF457 family)
MPYTHSLLSALVWAAVAYILFWVFPGKEKINKNRVALVIALAVFSHWVLDLLVHTPDLPLLGDSSPKLGLGLWNNALVTFALEGALLVAGVWLYLRGTEAKSAVGKYGMIVFMIVLLGVNFFNVFGPPPQNQYVLTAMSMTSYLAFGGVAFWLDRERS